MKRLKNMGNSAIDEQLRILIVDDEPNVLSSINRVLEGEGYEVLTASSAREGLRILDNMPVQLVITDYRMPEMDGIEFLRRVKEKWPMTVRIVLSVYKGEELLMSAINTGQVYKYILKPWDEFDLKLSITQALERYYLCKNNVRLTRALECRNEELQISNLELKEALHTKGMLMREMSHRIKNNLNMLQGLIEIQSEKASDGDSKDVIKDLIDMTESRIQTISILHEMLSTSHNLKNMSLSEYLKTLSEMLFNCYSTSNSNVRLVTDIEEVCTDIDVMVPCGLIMNELISNSLKYAFPDGRKGEISIGLNNDGKHNFTLTVKDNGVGFHQNPADMETKSLGMGIVYGLSKQIYANVALSLNGGTRFSININGRGRECEGKRMNSEPGSSLITCG